MQWWEVQCHVLCKHLFTGVTAKVSILPQGNLMRVRDKCFESRASLHPATDQGKYWKELLSKQRQTQSVWRVNCALARSVNIYCSRNKDTQCWFKRTVTIPTSEKTLRPLQPRTMLFPRCTSRWTSYLLSGSEEVNVQKHRLILYLWGQWSVLVTPDFFSAPEKLSLLPPRSWLWQGTGHSRSFQKSAGSCVCKFKRSW